jgi:hypothetical protein
MGLHQDCMLFLFVPRRTMSLWYNIPALLLVMIEATDAVKLMSHGSLLGQHWIVAAMNESSRSSEGGDDVFQHPVQDFLWQWIAVCKLCLSMSLVGSVMSTEPKVRVVFSTGSAVGLSTWFFRWGPALAVVEVTGMVPTGTYQQLNTVMIIVIISFVIGAGVEVSRALSLGTGKVKKT